MRTMRALHEPVEPVRLVAGEPGIDGVAMHTELLGDLRDAHHVADHGDDGVIALFHLAELLEHWPPPAGERRVAGQGVGYQPHTCRASPEHVSELSRRRNV